MEEMTQGPKPLDQLLGYPSTALTLAEGRYPVSMSRERLDGEVLVAAQRFENEADLKVFCDQKDSEEIALFGQLKEASKKDTAEKEQAQKAAQGYWRIRSL